MAIQAHQHKYPVAIQGYQHKYPVAMVDRDTSGHDDDDDLTKKNNNIITTSVGILGWPLGTCVYPWMMMIQ